MFNPLYSIGFSMFLVGTLVFAIIKRWNNKKLSSEELKKLEEINKNYGFFSKYYIEFIFVGSIISISILPLITGTSSLGLAMYIWSFAIGLAIDSYQKNKIIAETIDSYEFVKTNKLINYLLIDLLIVAGFFLFFS